VSASSDLALYRRVLGETRSHRLRVALIFLLSLLATPLALLTPLPLKIVVDSVVGHRPPPGFLRAVLPDSVVTSDQGVLVASAVMLVGIVLLTQLQVLATWVLQASTGERVLLAVRSHLFRHVQQLSLAHHDNRSSADFAYRIQYDTPSIEYLAVYGVIPFATALVMLAGMVVVTARID
jgi:ATP-binding cassette subfamily B protein